MERTLGAVPSRCGYHTLSARCCRADHQKERNEIIVSKVDQTVEKIKHGDETTMEKAGTKIKEAAEDVKRDMKK